MSGCANCDDLGVAVGPQGQEGKGYDATSSTNLNTLNTQPATETLTISVNKAYIIGTRARVSSTASPTVNFFEGVVTSYIPSTGIMNMAVDLFRGSGAFSSWSISVTGESSISGSRNLLVEIDPSPAGTSVGITETVIQSYSLPFGIFSTNNSDILRIRTYTNITKSANQKNIRTKFGGSVLNGLLGTAVIDANVGRIHHDIDLIRKTATAIKAIYYTIQTEGLFGDEIETLTTKFETGDIVVADLDNPANYPILIELTGEATNAGDTITADGMIIRIEK